MISVEIKEVENGFVVDLFESKGPVEWNTSVFYGTWLELQDALSEYFEKVEKWRIEH